MRENRSMKKAFIFSVVVGVNLLVVSGVHGAEAGEDSAPNATSIDERINRIMAPAARHIVRTVFYSVPVGTEKDPETGEPLMDVVMDPKTGEPMLDPETGEPVRKPRRILVPFVLIWLVFAALFFTLYFRFINLRCFKLAIDVVRGKYSDPRAEGEVSHFRALSTALSATVGLGNIAGVAIAISMGGPGATFWMILAGLLGMSAKFVECTLGVKYRQVDETGKVFGGPMYYISQGFRERGVFMGGIGKVLAVFFAMMCIGGSLGGGNIFQVNQAVSQVVNVTGEGTFIDQNRWLLGLIMAFLVALVIIGGIVSIARVTSRIVPFMCVLYVVAAIVILVKNAAEIPHAIQLIFKGAFVPQAVAGGFVGVLIQGFKRAAFSNEAGIGSAPIAHAAVKTEDPASEGIVALLEPFIDTVVVCTMTAVVIVITGNYANPDLDGVQLTSNAFGTVIDWFPLVLSVAVVLFAFSTMISWSYYGMQAWVYLFGRGTFKELSFKLLFCVFVVIGAAMSLQNVVDLSDAMIFAMCFPNVIGLYLLTPKVRMEVNSYLAKLDHEHKQV